jgi:hypothetical protein
MGDYASNMTKPQGLGLYIRHIDNPKTFPIGNMVQNNIKWVAIGGPWHEVDSNRWVNNPTMLKQATEIFTNAGLDVHVWGYPYFNKVQSFVDDLAQCTVPQTVGWLLDPELGFKGFLNKAKELLILSRAEATKRNLVLGMTSYGLPRLHATFPFSAFAAAGEENPLKECDYGSPQLYTVSDRQIVEGLRSYEAVGFNRIIPSFGLFKHVVDDPSKPFSASNKKAVSRTVEELDRHLEKFLRSGVKFDGMIGWSSNFIDPKHWVVLHKYAAELEHRGRNP